MFSEFTKEQVRTFGPNVLNDPGLGQSRVFDVSDIPPGGSLYTKNIRFGGTSITSRYAIEGQLFQAADAEGADPTGISPHSCIGDLYVSTPTNNSERYFYTDPADNRRISCYFKDLTKAKHLVSGTPALQGFAYQEVGITALIAGYDAGLNGAFAPIRIDVSESPADLDDLKQEPVFPPLPTVDTATPSSQNTGGFVTTGSHKIGYIFRTRFGAYTLPVEVGTVTIGGSNTGAIGLTLETTTPWPEYYESAFVIMTTSTSSTRYFLVPESQMAVPVGTTTDIVWDAAGASAITAADTTLETYQDATAWFSLLRPDPGSGQLPFLPFYITSFGNRTVYLVQRVPGSNSAQVLVSDAGDPASVTTDQHALFLPTSEKLTAAFEVGGTLSVCTDMGTRRYMDSGDVPSLWPNPNVISKTLGATGPQAVAMNDNGTGGYVMSRDGNVWYYTVDGYSHQPLSALIYEHKFDAHIDPSAKLTLDPRENILYCCFSSLIDVSMNATPGEPRKDRKRSMIFDVGDGMQPETVRLSEWMSGEDSTRIWLNKVVINPNVYQYSGVKGAIFALCHETFGTSPKCAIGITTIYQGAPNIARDRIRYIDDAEPSYVIPVKGSYHTGYFPSQKESSGDILDHRMIYFSFRGVCNVDISVKPLNDSSAYPIHRVEAGYGNLPGSAPWGSGVWGTFTWGGAYYLDAAPTNTYRRIYSRKADKLAYIFEFETDPNNGDSFFQLTEITHFYRKWAERR